MRNRLIQLLADNRKPYTPVAQRIVAAADGSEATVYLYDAIVGDRATAEWCGGVCPQDLVPALAAITAPTIHLRVNSPGGDVFAAEAICQAMREHSAHIVAHIEGLAASAATMVCCAADEVVATPSSKYMIHKTWTFAIGNADDMRSAATLLDACDGSMFDQYEARTGADRAQIEQWCADETWFTAQQAIGAKFIDRLADTNTAKAVARWNLRAYAHVPADLLTADTVQTPAPPPPEPAHASADHRNRQQQRTRAALLTARIE
jgi:ATP-dependent Clp protease protease subunit